MSSIFSASPGLASLLTLVVLVLAHLGVSNADDTVTTLPPEIEDYAVARSGAALC